MTRPLLAAAALAALLPTAAFADLTFNAGAVSDYRYRGISQSRLKPAVQGGLDFTQGAFYLGAWGSTIRWVKDLTGDADVELDLYGGYKIELAKGVPLDLGLLAYVYPSNGLAPSANTTEIYGSVGFGPATAKLSYALTDTFGNPDSKGSWYADLSASFEVGGGWTLAPHLGHQKITGPAGGSASYSDWSLAVSKDFSGIVPSLSLVGSNADKAFYIPGPAANSTRFLGKSALVVGVKVNF